MRRKSIAQWCLVSIFLSLILTASFFIKFSQYEDRGSYSDHLTTKRVIRANPNLAHFSHVTKSLSELGKMDEMSKSFLFLNHVPKCGSEILILLLQKMQGLNNYRHVRLTGGNKRRLTSIQQEELVDEVYNIIRNEGIPLSFDRHAYFVNFSSFDKQAPTYINLIRDPVEKVISRSSIKSKSEKENYFLKCLLDEKNNCSFKDGMPYDLSIPYFCGHNRRCMLLNNKWALDEAKNNVDRYYPVVGVLEELNATLEVLEHKIPYFFKGVQMHYATDLLVNFKNKKQLKVSNKIKDKLRSVLKTEYDFYEWIKGRLFGQLQIMYGEHRNH